MYFCRSISAVAMAVLLAAAGTASAHKERPIDSPIREGSVPDLGRKASSTIVVCKASSRPTRAQLLEARGRIRSATGVALDQAKRALSTMKANTKLFKKCHYEHIQAAVNAASDDTAIKVMPGVYREEPSRAAPTTTSGDLPNGAYSYDYHVAHPNDANLIAILGKKNITLEGTGADPRDVLIDAGFVKDVPIRADRADGIVIRNLWARDGNEHCIYVVETAGYVFDRTVGSFCREYELFSFASDLGLFTDCEAEGGGDSGIYTGGNPDTSPADRFSVEIRNCTMHTNALGFSGTQGSSVWMHDNDVYDNAVGLSFDTENDHPNPPQRKSLIEDNLLHDNNLDIYAADTPTPAGGPAYGFLRYPVGTGMWIVGGDDNVIRNNFIWGNQRFGVMIYGNPLEGPVLAEVNRNQIVGNVIGVDPDGNAAPNGTVDPPGTTPFVEGSTDLFWGGSGNDNCWGPQDGRSGPIKYGPAAIAAFQPCPFRNTGNTAAFPRPEVADLLLSCILEEDPSNPGRFVTTDSPYPCPWGHENFSSYQNRNEQECGNGMVDVGEECDAGYGGGVATETCASLGLGDGTLACNAHCDHDPGGCTSSACGAFATGGFALQLGGTDRGALAVSAMEVGGRTFDPTVDGVDLTFRTSGVAVASAHVPPGASGWRVTEPGWRFGGPAEGVRSLSIRRDGALGAKFVDVVAGEIRGVSVVEVVIRIGDDCWRGELSCTSSRSGNKLACAKRRRT
jgi:hypothetical protein